MERSSLKRINVFCGHYGSGKTNIAVNYALMLKKRFERVAIADLDIVNPYFRTKDAADILKQNSIRVISSPYANSNVDTPALPAEIYSVTDEGDLHAVIDVGGDDRGALALGRFKENIERAGGCNLFFVINMYRPLTKAPEEAFCVLKEIEAACRMRFDYIINNSNLGEATTAHDIERSFEYARAVESLTGLKTAFTTVKTGLYPKIKGKAENIIPIKLFVRQSWEERNE